MSHHDTESKVKILNEWLAAEDDTIAMTNQITGASGNDTVKIFMDVIRTDSAKHKRIQEFLKTSMTEKAPTLSFHKCRLTRCSPTRPLMPISGSSSLS